MRNVIQVSLSCDLPQPAPTMKNRHMQTELSFASLAGIETELLTVVAADTQTAKGPEAKPQPTLLVADAAVQAGRGRGACDRRIQGRRE